MTGATITFRVMTPSATSSSRGPRAEKVNLSDYIRVRLGLRGHGSEADGDGQIDPQHEAALQERVADHERRLRALEADDVSGRARD